MKTIRNGLGGHFWSCLLNPFHCLQYVCLSIFWILNCLDHLNVEHPFDICFQRLNALVRLLKNQCAYCWEKISFIASNPGTCCWSAAQLSRSKRVCNFSLMNHLSSSWTYFVLMFFVIHTLVFASYFTQKLSMPSKYLRFTNNK